MIIDVRIFDMSFNGENLGSDLNYGPGVSFWARLVLKTRFEINGSDSELQNVSLDYKSVPTGSFRMTHTV